VPLRNHSHTLTTQLQRGVGDLRLRLRPLPQLTKLNMRMQEPKAAHSLHMCSAFGSRSCRLAVIQRIVYACTSIECLLTCWCSMLSTTCIALEQCNATSVKCPIPMKTLDVYVLAAGCALAVNSASVLPWL
jgi:hypothetical protein